MKIFACLLLLLALSRPARPDALPPPVVPQCVGVNIHFTGAPAQDLDGLARGGFGWVRMDFTWSLVEKTKGQYDFSPYDALLAGLTARGIRPLWIFDYGSDLYQIGSPRSPEARAAFARFAAAAAAHFRGKPILWEIWNEPNIGFWKPAPNAAEYGRLALETAQAVKKADPNATVLAPGSSTIPLDFLETVFKMGLLRWVDAVSLHPYRGNEPESAAPDYAAVRRLIHQYAPPGKDVPLVSSEWGYSSVNVSEEQQGRYLARQWLSNLAEGIRLSIWYDWHEDGPDPKEPEHHFGTVRPDYAPKPAFEAARTLTAVLGGYRFVKRLPLKRGGDYLLLFAQGRAVKLAFWTVAADHDLSLPGGQTLHLTGSPQYRDVTGDAALRAASAWTATPPETLYAAGQTPRLSLAFRSRDGLPHRARMLLAVTPLGGRTTLVASREDFAKPDQPLRWEASVPSLARTPALVRVGLTLDGVRQPYSQEVALTPTDPLGVSVAPLGGGRLRVQISNPAGTAFSGRLTSEGSLSIPVRLTPGQKALEVTLPGPRAPRLTLRDGRGARVAQAVATQFVPYPAAPSGWTAALDGDLKLPSTVGIRPGVGPGGAAALRVDYQLAPGWSFGRFEVAGPGRLPGRPVGLGLWLCGDGSGNLARMRFQDTTGQTFQINGLPITWQGWRFVPFRLASASGTAPDVSHWGGANDGQVHYPVSVQTAFLLDAPADAAKRRGTLWLRQPFVLYAGSDVPKGP